MSHSLLQYSYSLTKIWSYSGQTVWLYSFEIKYKTLSLLKTKINERSLVKLYERTKMAITQPMYIASFLPGSVFLEVRREMFSYFWIKTYFESFKLSMRKILLNARTPSSCLLICLSGPGNLEDSLFRLEFEFCFSLRIEITSFFNMSIPLKLLLRLTVTLRDYPTLYHTSWHKLQSILKYCIWDIESQICYTVMNHHWWFIIIS